MDASGKTSLSYLSWPRISSADYGKRLMLIINIVSDQHASDATRTITCALSEIS